MENLSPMHLMGKAAWLLTALASIHVGAFAVFGFNLFSYLPESWAFVPRYAYSRSVPCCRRV